MNLSKYFNNEFSEFIKEARINSGLSLEELSTRTELSLEDLKAYEEGKKLIPSNDFSLIMEATNTPKNKVIHFLHDMYVFGATNSDEKGKVS